MAVYTKLSEVKLKEFFSKYNLGKLLNYKEITRSYNSRLFHQKRDFHIDLVDFIYSICDYNEPYVDDRIKVEDLHVYEVEEFEVIEYEK